MDHEQVNVDAFEEDPVDALVHRFFTAFSSSLCRRYTKKFEEVSHGKCQKIEVSLIRRCSVCKQLL